MGWPFPKAFESSCTITLRSALDKSTAANLGHSLAKTVEFTEFDSFSCSLYRWLIMLICLEACSILSQSWRHTNCRSIARSSSLILRVVPLSHCVPLCLKGAVHLLLCPAIRLHIKISLLCQDWRSSQGELLQIWHIKSHQIFQCPKSASADVTWCHYVAPGEKSSHWLEICSRAFLATVPLACYLGPD